MKRVSLLTNMVVIIMSIMLTCMACDQESSFKKGGTGSLVMQQDTVSFDTVFSGFHTATRSLWVYNTSSHQIRCDEICLLRKNQSGYKVNVDGIPLASHNNYTLRNIIINSGDSIRVFVELQPQNVPEMASSEIKDALVFKSDDGRKQQILLQAFAITPCVYGDLIIKTDTVLQSSRPIVITKSMTINPDHTLTINPGTRLYFADVAGLTVNGRLLVNGKVGNPVLFRGLRTDNIFDYLPYDRLSGQWKGIKFTEKSHDNKIDHADIHGAMDGIILESTHNNQKTLAINSSIIHNCKGYGIKSEGGTLELINSQITNHLSGCLFITSGHVIINSCTIAQFYPFEVNRGKALSFDTKGTNEYQVKCKNSVITGYADEEIDANGLKNGHVKFDNCLLRIGSFKEMATDNILEDINDTTVYGEKNFRIIDNKNMIFDFRPSVNSKMIGTANKNTVCKKDLNGIIRDQNPDLGAYEFIRTEKNIKSKINYKPNK